MFSTSASADICDRNPVIVKQLELYTKKKCEKIKNRDLSKLEVLHLHGTPVLTISASDLQGLTSLHTLELRRCGLTRLPEDLFRGVPRLVKLDLEGNSFRTFPSGLFKGLRFLSEVIFDNNPLETLADGTFDDLPSLIAISFRNIQNLSLSEGFFLNVTALRHLIIDFEINVNGVGPANNLFVPKQPASSLNLGLAPSVEIRGWFKHNSRGTESDRIYSIQYLSTRTDEISQIEDYVPAAYARLNEAGFTDWNYYFFEMLPHSDGTDTLHKVREEAIVVCDAFPEFCDVRQRIHAFPIPAHLVAAEELYKRKPDARTLVLIESLRKFFGRGFDYEAFNPQLASLPVAQEIESFLAIKVPTLAHIAKLSLTIHTLIKENSADAGFISKYQVPLLSVQSYLQFVFKSRVNDHSMKLDRDHLAALTESLIQMSESRFLLTARESKSLRDQIVDADTVGKLKSIVDQGIRFQADRLQALYLKSIAQVGERVRVQLEPIYQEVVRTSLVAEWDHVLQEIKN